MPNCGQALMRSLSLKDFEHEGKWLEAAEALEICGYVFDQSLARRSLLDMPVLVNRFQD
jgi:hypothetical protein